MSRYWSVPGYTMPVHHTRASELATPLTSDHAQKRLLGLEGEMIDTHPSSLQGREEGCSGTGTVFINGFYCFTGLCEARRAGILSFSVNLVKLIEIPVPLGIYRYFYVIYWFGTKCRKAAFLAVITAGFSQSGHKQPLPNY